MKRHPGFDCEIKIREIEGGFSVDLGRNDTNLGQIFYVQNKDDIHEAKKEILRRIGESYEFLE